MIEVEKKFKPTKEQLDSLLLDAEFLKEVTLHDVYYDYPDYRMFKKEIRLRKRNDSFELKIGDDEVEGTAEEVEDEKEIQKYFQIDKPLDTFVQDDLIEIINYSTNRKKYKKGDFIIDLDRLDFGYECVEIELQVENDSQVKHAHERIIELVKKYDFDLSPVTPKRESYFKIYKSEIHKELYEKRDEDTGNIK